MWLCVVVVSALVGVQGQVVTPPPPSDAQAPSAASPAPLDPATSAFDSDAGVILVTVKPAMTAAYEDVLRVLQGALATASDPDHRTAAAGWRVFKAAETDAKGNAVYVHLMLPAVRGFDYRPSLLVDTLVEELAPDLLTTYRESIAGAPSKLSLTELGHMAVAPVPIQETKKPGGR